MKFFRRGKSKIIFCPAVADPAAPTNVELDAGEDLSEHIAEINGFQLTNSGIPTPNLAEEFVGQIDGEDTVADSSLVIYDDETASVVRDLLPKGTVGVLVFMPYGRVAAKRCESWPVKSAGVNDEWDMGNTSARFAVPFRVTSKPEQEGVIPAAA